jgi:hypothetical protein
MRSRIASIENLICRDPACRNVFALVQRDHLRLAALSLMRAQRVLLTSGFPILGAGVGETDGPPGVWALGRALSMLGVEVAFVTDPLHRPLFEALGARPLLSWEPDLLGQWRPTHLVAVERPGRARDGRYYNMKGEEITHLVAPLDGLFLEAESRGIVTIGIGDGGNEVGMGRVFQKVIRSIPHGMRIASTVDTDYVIVAGVSNWGAYGLAGALSVLSGRDLLPSVDDLRRSVQAVVDAGGVDGVSGRKEVLVDGQPLSKSVEILQEIRWHLLPSIGERIEGLRVGILGAGQSGLAVARLLRQRGAASIRISDQGSVEIPPDLEDCPWERGGHRLEFLAGSDVVVRSPGVPPHLRIVRELMERGIPVLSELEVSSLLGGRPLVAVTGSVGKRSTVSLMGRILAQCGMRVAVGGNKGRPLSQLLLEEPADRFLLAVSSYQLESIVRFHPEVAVLLNLGALHLERHGDIQETLRVKGRIFMNQGPGDLLVLNRDDPRLGMLAERHWGQTAYVSSRTPVDRGAWVTQGRIRLAWEDGERDLGKLSAPFPENLLSAVVTGAFLGVDPERLKASLEGLEMLS